jgi:5-methylcytosine-specific restriction endonuclease McrA
MKYEAQARYRAKNKEKIAAASKAYRQAHGKELYERHKHSLRTRWSRLKARARRLGRKFRIAYETYVKMIEDGCYYCGADLMNAVGGSLDRVNNNNYNYTTKNVVACCTDCNNLKNYQLTKDETVYVVKSLKRYRKANK